MLPGEKTEMAGKGWEIPERNGGFDKFLMGTSSIKSGDFPACHV